MIEIKIPKEISEYKGRLMFGLTVRQLLSLAAALAVCVPLYIFGSDLIGDDLIGWIIILIAAPILAFGFLKFNGMNFEHIAGIILRQQFIEPQKRTYQELPVYWYCREEIIADEIAHQQAEIKRQKGRKKNGKRKGA